MRNKFFKFNENYAKVIKHLDDKQAGQYVKAISDYAFEGKTYGRQRRRRKNGVHAHQTA